MFVTEAIAQTAGATPGAGDIIGFVFPMIAIAAVFYFFMIRPQQAKAKEHQAMLSKVARGDTVVTHGGLIGKVVRVVDDNELLVEVGKGVEVRVLRQGLADVRAKGEPMKAEAANDTKKK
ncbi:MAG: preprotein translocase subunit YajC [Alphaproteobacteria bacterium]|nr:preprotein translocase subunit YajC [Alphaproteobacteria bacterium]